jgi:DNA-binding FadR family transcriptional regulator
VSTYAIRRRGLQAEIQDIVKRYIIDHRFRPGDALPGEGELAKQMGISRPSLREAMKVLQTIGVIETRHGSGTYVGSLSLNPLADGMAFQILIAAQHSSSAPQDLLDLVDLRQALEMSEMRKVVGNHSDEQISRMRSIINEMRLMDPESARFGERDLALHLAFYQPLNSRVYSEFMRVFWKISNMAIRPYAPASRDAIVAEHERIVDAIEAKDTEAAVAAVQEHICHLAETIRTSYDPESLHAEALRSLGAEEDGI